MANGPFANEGGRFFPSVRHGPAMNPATVLGLAAIAVGLGGYGLGVSTAYPGRAFSITLVMVGITVLAMRGVIGERAAEP